MCATPGACTSRQSTRTSKKACFPERLAGASVCSLHCTNGAVPPWSCPSACRGLLVARNGSPAGNQRQVSKGFLSGGSHITTAPDKKLGHQTCVLHPALQHILVPEHNRGRVKIRSDPPQVPAEESTWPLHVFNWRPVPLGAAVRTSKQASSTERLGVWAVATSCAGGSLRTLSLLVTVL